MSKGTYSKISIEKYIQAQNGNEEAFNELFLAHKNLINYMISRVQITEDINLESYREAFTDALCKAILTFNPETDRYIHSTFNKYAFVCMSNAGSRVTSKNANSRTKYQDVLNTQSVVSLNSTTYKDEAGEKISLIETIADENASRNEQISYRLVPENLYNLLSDNEKICVKGLLHHKSHRQIALELGVSTSCITERVAKMRTRMNRLIRICNLVINLERKGYTFEEINEKLELPSIRDSRKYHFIYKYIYGEIKQLPENTYNTKL